jgi:hypothetical protein
VCDGIGGADRPSRSSERMNAPETVRRAGGRSAPTPLR